MSHEGNCYCPNCDRSFDRLGCERETEHYRLRFEHEAERVQNVLDIAMRGYTYVTAWNGGPAFAGAGEMVPVEWTCQSCNGKQREPGACKNPACVPGQVMRALNKETRVLRRERALAAPPAGAGAETAKGTTMKPADILIAAAERLERLGWCQGSYGGPAGPNCVRGAISRVVGDVEVGTQARWMLSRAIDTPVDRLTTWNDDPARTKEEVVAALRRAASALAGTGGRR